MEQSNKKIGLFSLIMMIFSSIFGFANLPVAFLQMGYASIFWYIFAAVVFFVPVALMLAEYGSTFPDAHGGIYDWLAHAIGEKLAFIGTFIWLASWIVWLISTSAKVFIPLATFIFGYDATTTWHFFGLSSPQFLSILAVLWIILVTYLASRGANFIAKITRIGGIFVSAMVVVFVIASSIILVMTHAKFAQPLTFASFIKSPNPQFSSPISVLGFSVYAIFAYAGMESLGGIVDNLKNPTRTFPLGLCIAAGLITFAYSIMILLWGVSINWQQTLNSPNVTLGNITYVMMQQLGIVLGQNLGLSSAYCHLLGNVFIRFVGLGMFLAYVGAFFLLIYSPLKAFVCGAKKLLPEKFSQLAPNGVPKVAMSGQAIIVCVLVLLVGFGGKQAQGFYTILTDMANVATACPYLFLVGAFIPFKNKHFAQPIVIFKNPIITKIVCSGCFLVIFLGIVFTCIAPFLAGDVTTGIWTWLGPIGFGGSAWLLYHYFASK